MGIEKTPRNAARFYRKMGLNVIPVGHNKKSLVKWEFYQRNLVEPHKIDGWWDKWPKANVAVITGRISNLTVVDVDSEAGKAALNEYLSDSLSVPVAKTPRGWHYWFQYTPDLTNAVKVLTDCDVRNDGGYIIAPPSRNGEGGYRWLTNPFQNRPPVMPQSLVDILSCGETAIKKRTNTSSIHAGVRSYYNNENQISTQSNNLNNLNIRELGCEKGTRDETLFHLANALQRAGMPDAEARFYLYFFAEHCNPPFPKNEVDEKLKSAEKRSDSSDFSLTQEIRNFIISTTGQFNINDIQRFKPNLNNLNMASVSAIFCRLAKEGVIKRVGGKNGNYRRVEEDAPAIDIFNVQEMPIQIEYPLGEHEIFRTESRNIITIAGTSNAGKSAYALRFAALNMGRGMPIRYMTSEMSGVELVKRLKLFTNVDFNDWKNVEFRDVSFGFSDYIVPDGINIIDYWEFNSQSEGFYAIGDGMREIYEKLTTGIALVCVQKKKGQDTGRGGEFGLEKPRLYISIEAHPPEPSTARIIKCKNPIGNEGHDGKRCEFELRNGNYFNIKKTWSF